MKTLAAFIAEAWTMHKSQTPYATAASAGEKREEHAKHTKKERGKRRRKKDKAVFAHDIGVVTHQ